MILSACDGVEFDFTPRPGPPKVKLAPQPEPEPTFEDHVIDQGLPPWANLAEYDHPLIRKWKAERLIFRACFPKKSHPKCPTDDQLADMDWRDGKIYECLGCAGHFDPLDTSACKGLCMVKKMKFGRVVPGGCVCGGYHHEWDRSYCEMATCGDYGFEWIRTKRSGYWSLPPRPPKGT